MLRLFSALVRDLLITDADFLVFADRLFAAFACLIGAPSGAKVTVRRFALLTFAGGVDFMLLAFRVARRFVGAMFKMRKAARRVAILPSVDVGFAGGFGFLVAPF